LDEQLNVNGWMCTVREEARDGVCGVARRYKCNAPRVHNAQRGVHVPVPRPALQMLIFTFDPDMATVMY
jgi:hypothetical protein